MIRAWSAKWPDTQCCLDSPGLRADEAVGIGHVSRPAPQACRYISRRIRLSLQSPLLPACVVRKTARPDGAPRAVSYWDIVGRANPRKGEATARRAPRHRKTAVGMRRDGTGGAQTEGQNHHATTGPQTNLGQPGTTQ